MGEMADMQMGSEDIWWFPSEPNHSPSVDKVITCTYCGKKGLRWKQINDKWRLVEKGEPHICSEYFKAKSKNTLTLEGELVDDKGDGSNE